MTRTLAAGPFKVLLERVYLGGTVEECLLQVTKGIGHVDAIDMTNSVLLIVNEALPGLDDGKYGLSQLGTLIKFLGSCADEELIYNVTEDKKWLTVRRKGHGRLAVLLLEDDMVGTRVENPQEIKKILTDYKISFKLEARFVEDAVSFMSYVGGQSVNFQIRDGKVSFRSSIQNATQKFDVNVTKLDLDNVKDMNVSLYSDQISKVFAAVHLGENSRLFLRADHPIIVLEDARNLWALTNLA